MATITQERLKELDELYSQLKEKILFIDSKYSLQYQEPQLDMPDSLNLQKLTYTPKSEAELKELSEQYVAATMLSKQRTVESSYSTKIKLLARKRTELSNQYAVKFKKLDDDYTDACEQIERKLINNGLLFSTTGAVCRSNALKDYNANKKDCMQTYTNDLNAINTEEKDVDAVYKESCDKLEEERQALIAKRYQALLDADEKERVSIEKYNNSLEEKEQKYQLSRAKLLDTARRNEQSRVTEMTKLYYQLGETNYYALMYKEKYYAAQNAFASLKRSEAQLILDMDGFLMMHLDTYYSTLVNWVNTKLPA